MKQTSTNTKHHRVTAVVVTYNRLALLKESIAALETQDTPIKNLYVVDNASSDDTQEWMKQKIAQQSPLNIVYLRMDQNLGGAAGFEYGLRQIKLDDCDWVWIMDDDSIAHSDALTQLLQSDAANDDRVGALCSKVVDPEGGLVNVPAMFDWTFGKTHPIPLASFDDKETSVDAATFVGFFVRSSVIGEVGYPRGDYFIQSDDFEYSLRIRKAGYKLVLVSDSVILHKITLIKEKRSSGDYIPVSELWKYYYLLRNEILSLSLYLPSTFSRWRFYLWHFYRVIKNSLRILGQDHTLLRLEIEWRAFADGVFNRSGKRLDPVLFKQRIAEVK